MTFLKKFILKYYEQRKLRKIPSVPPEFSAVFDISKIPLAREGSLHQLSHAGGVKMMAALDRLIKENGLDYWVGYGSVIGLLRHNGNPVPWDDDIDICFRAEDYEKLIGVLEKIIPNDDFWILSWGPVTQLIHKASGTSIDMYCHNTITSDDPYVKNSGRISKLQEGYLAGDFFSTMLYRVKMRSDMPVKKVRRSWEKLRQLVKSRVRRSDKVFEEIKGATKTIMPLQWGTPGHDFMEFDTLFPTQRRMFMGREFSFPNNPELYVLKRYGDIYTKFPSDIFRGHYQTVRNRMQRYLELKKFLELSDDEVWAKLTAKAKYLSI